MPYSKGVSEEKYSSEQVERIVKSHRPTSVLMVMCNNELTDIIALYPHDLKAWFNIYVSRNHEYWERFINGGKIIGIDDKCYHIEKIDLMG